MRYSLVLFPQQHDATSASVTPLPQLFPINLSRTRSAFAVPPCTLCLAGYLLKSSPDMIRFGGALKFDCDQHLRGPAGVLREPC